MRHVISATPVIVGGAPVIPAGFQVWHLVSTGYVQPVRNPLCNPATDRYIVRRVQQDSNALTAFGMLRLDLPLLDLAPIGGNISMK